MARTLTQLQEELNRRVDDTVDTDVSKQWLNVSWQEALDYYPWPFLVASVTGTLGGVTTTQTFSSVFSVTNVARIAALMANDVIFTRVDWTDKDISGQSYVYALDPDMTGFVTPGAETGTAYLKYVKTLSNLDAASDTLSAPASGEEGVPNPWVDQFEEALISGAAARYYEQAQKPGLSTYWRGQRDNYLDSIIEAVTRLSTSDAVQFRTPDFNESGSMEF
jgi:hypothetical protein